MLSAFLNAHGWSLGTGCYSSLITVSLTRGLLMESMYTAKAAVYTSQTQTALSLAQGKESPDKALVFKSDRKICGPCTDILP